MTSPATESPTLREVLTRLGFSTRPTGGQGRRKHIVGPHGTILLEAATPPQVWTWLNDKGMHPED